MVPDDAPAPDPAGVDPAALDPAALSPALAALISQRESLQAGVAALTGGDPADPRYAVTPMAVRRAELARWAAARDRPREAAPDRPSTPPTVAPEISLLAGAMPLPLRPTPGEAVPAGRPPIDPRAWMAARDAVALGDGVTNRRAPPQPVGDALDRRLTRARDLVSRTRAAEVVANRALDAARDAIPSDWRARAADRIPGLGRADPYVRETARKLAVAVGSIDELTSRADQLREMAGNVRDLREADAANDDARRDRALDRLRARRAEES
ncbi:hypothetical protein [uncultured Brevundimonas sp.]|uniref:hypothetical protein n=1 Tax=uncultured Brevundimonas sp. TaxID=213418 RepID=UPI0030EEFFBD